MAAPDSLDLRIMRVMAGQPRMPYQAVLEAVFPIGEYPDAWRTPTTGGPPGCAMAFGAALRRLGGGWHHDGPDRYVWLPTLADRAVAR